LKDARTRDQVDEAFRDILERGWAGKARAAYSEAADFNTSSDEIAGHYAPLIAAALRALVPKAKLEGAASGKASKAVVESPAAGDEDSDALLAELQKIVNSTAVAKLTDLVTSLYGDAALQAAHHASQALGADLADWVTDLDLPKDYWDAWQPGWGEAAAKVAGGGLKDLLDQADVSIKGMTHTTLERLGNTLADGLASGDSIQTVASAALDMGADPGRALTIANTEMARAMSATSDDTYTANGVQKVDSSS
jgi:hypothetical protein